MSNEAIFDDKYISSSSTSGKILDEVQPQKETEIISVSPEFEKYGTGKPKRVIVRGKISQ